MFVSRTGLIIIAGGKLTGYRKMAMRVVDLVAKKMMDEHGHSIGKCITGKTQLQGGNIAMPFERFLQNKIKEAISLGLTQSQATDLCQRYGSETSEVFRLYSSLKNTNYTGEVPLVLMAELKYSMEKEMCLTPSDFFIRRTGMLYFDMASVQKWRGAVLHYMQVELGWNDAEKARYDDELGKAIEGAIGH
jgi:glycerol-3-phosphate dehydrogenase